MSPDIAAAQIEHFRDSICKLRAARGAIENGSPAGVAALDEAIAAFEAGALALAEEVAATDWWQATDAAALAALIPAMAGLVGVVEDGPVERLAEKIGTLVRPRDQDRKPPKSRKGPVLRRAEPS